MTDSPARLPPADPADVTLTYQHRHHMGDDADTAPETWRVYADIYDDGTKPVEHVADMDIVAVDLYDTRDPFGLLDDEEADLGLVAGAIFNVRSGRLDQELDDLIEPLGSRILILNSVRLAPRWRGFGLGVLFAGTAIRKLSGGARAAVCYPAPLGETDEGELSEARRERAVNKLGKVWAQLGFEHFRDGVHVLDLNLATLEESLERLHEKAALYRTP
ncbi:hypothetical protein [Actinomadura sp. DC4]|uniref:hypothetical protein n=1 Tax=Actinomadura sp. DC4 TaxID=3055069 RepID=UPI0025B1CCFD|nr:hypothetical protein [Actinomadura sp. DC4]MDN3351335.1 hypothetical protein [Actinomadura sp. DC4]